MGREGSLTRAIRQIRPGRGRFVLTFVLVVTTAVLLARGYDFYMLGLEDRVEHEDYRILSPGSIVGHGYGIVGTALILTNLLYLVRRRVAAFRLGSMEAWMNLHVVTGLVGSVLILFHSAFQLRTPIATVTSVSLATVVLTGVVGRYFYALAPKPDSQQLADNLLALDALVPGLGNLIRKGLKDAKVTFLPANASLVRALGTIPRWSREGRARRNLVREAFHEVTRPHTMLPEELTETNRIIRETATLARGEARTAAGTALLRSWRGLHRFLAVLMILSVTSHIVVAWFYGYRWIWSE